MNWWAGRFVDRHEFIGVDRLKIVRRQGDRQPVAVGKKEGDLRIAQPIATLGIFADLGKVRAELGLVELAEGEKFPAGEQACSAGAEVIIDGPGGDGDPGGADQPEHLLGRLRQRADAPQLAAALDGMAHLRVQNMQEVDLLFRVKLLQRFVRLERQVHGGRIGPD